MARFTSLVLSAVAAGFFQTTTATVVLPRDTCVPEFGSSVSCTSDGCVQLVCCPGLISVADLCRDPCDVDPASCATTSSVASRDTCVPEFGSSVSCTADGCVQLVCCPGLISVADLCRDPCDVAPSSCATTLST